MAIETKSLSSQPAWIALKARAESMRAVTLRELFAKDAGRGERLTVSAEGLLLDYSKNRVDDETLKLLFSLAEQCGVKKHAEAMFRGD
ncbi:MAG: glucose-6-phosphate isomerase, partial [Janthinobacterium lividum]